MTIGMIEMTRIAVERGRADPANCLGAPLQGGK